MKSEEVWQRIDEEGGVKREEFRCNEEAKISIERESPRDKSCVFGSVRKGSLGEERGSKGKRAWIFGGGGAEKWRKAGLRKIKFS